jgi:hypothetical protein
MIFKILIPLFVMAAVYFVGKNHARKEQLQETPQTDTPQLLEEKGASFQLVAYTLALCIFGLAAWYIYDDWRESKILARIRVINAETGKVVLYDAPKGLIYGRAFTTADGRRVTLADVERMEVQPIE